MSIACDQNFKSLHIFVAHLIFQKSFKNFITEQPKKFKI